MLNEELAEVVRTISRISEKVQSVTDKQRACSKKIQLKIHETETFLKTNLKKEKNN